MSARPRKATNEEIYEAAHRVMQRLGPTEWTLAEVAAEVGLTAGALVQRFGSKRDLQLAMMDGFEEMAGETFARLRSENASPLATLYAYADCIAQMGETPGGLAHHLAYLQLDLIDPEFHRHLSAYARATRAELRSLIEEAIRAGELRPADSEALARTIDVILTGSLLTWGIYQERAAAEWLREDLDAVLGPFLPRERTRV
jgi:AcrR family transcriptional regulator